MKVKLAKSDSEILNCFDVLCELRPALNKDSFLVVIRGLEKTGYNLAYIEESGRPVSAAGYRISENLAWGRFLYVDDLITSETNRSQGYGSRMLSWLTDFAKKEGCSQLHLDSGMQRIDAHRFYEREEVLRTGYHFAKTINS